MSDRLAPTWFCVWCGATSLNPCNHSGMYRWAWGDKIQPVSDKGELIRDVALARLDSGAAEGDA